MFNTRRNMHFKEVLKWPKINKHINAKIIICQSSKFKQNKFPAV